MQLPFTDFAVPSPLYIAVLFAATVFVSALLYALRPAVTQRTVLAFVPWMVVGATLHVFHQLGDLHATQVYPPTLAPLFAAPAVYVTTFVLMGLVWIGATMVTAGLGEADRTAWYLGWIGVGVAVALLGLFVRQGLDPAVGPLEPVAPTLAIVAALALSFVLYLLLGIWRTYVVADAGVAGFLVVFAHVLDGVSTTVGVDVLGTGERSVLPHRIMEFAGTLPTAEYIGTGWLFVLLKAALAVAIVYLFAEYVREEPTRGNLFFAVVVAVGLGPAVNNLLVFLLGA